MKPFYRGMSWAWAVFGMTAYILGEPGQATYFVAMGVWWHLVGEGVRCESTIT